MEPDNQLRQVLPYSDPTPKGTTAAEVAATHPDFKLAIRLGYLVGITAAVFGIILLMQIGGSGAPSGFSRAESLQLLIISLVFIAPGVAVFGFSAALSAGLRFAPILLFLSSIWLLLALGLVSLAGVLAAVVDPQAGASILTIGSALLCVGTIKLLYHCVRVLNFKNLAGSDPAENFSLKNVLDPNWLQNARHAYLVALVLGGVRVIGGGIMIAVGIMIVWPSLPAGHASMPSAEIPMDPKMILPIGLAAAGLIALLIGLTTIWRAVRHRRPALLPIRYVASTALSTLAIVAIFVYHLSKDRPFKNRVVSSETIILAAIVWAIWTCIAGVLIPLRSRMARRP